MGLNKFEIISKCIDEIKKEALDKNLNESEMHDFLIKKIDEYQLRCLIRKSGISKSKYIVWIMNNKLHSAGFAMQLYEELFIEDNVA